MAYLIDGNNFLGHTDPHSVRSSESRQHLIRRLRAFQRATRARVLLVFDGGPEPSPNRSSPATNRFAVLFPRRWGNADELIKDIIGGETDTRRLFVVTSDRDIRSFARSRRAHPISCPEFERLLRRVLRRERKEKELDKPGVKLSPLEVRFWTDLFLSKK